MTLHNVPTATGASTRASAVVTFSAGPVLYAVPVDRVQEILDLQPITALPNAPPYLLGLADVRGVGVAVVDLRSLLGLPALQDTPQTRIIVTSVQSGVRPGAARVLIGLKTERVIEVTALDDGKLHPMEGADLLQWTDTAVVGIGRRNGGFVTLLDLDRLFDPARIPANRTQDTGSVE